jgi:hypothetical protein
MLRFGRFLRWAAAAVAAVAVAGCSSGGSSSGLTTASILDDGLTPAGDAPAITNEDPLARPIFTAWTSARARRCGFYFDPAKLRTAYFSYEVRQGAQGEQLARLEKAYDTTEKTIAAKIAGVADYCTQRTATAIKVDLQRQLAGDFSPNFPKPKIVAGGGWFDFGSGPRSEPFDSKKFFEQQDQNKGSKR